MFFTDGGFARKKEITRLIEAASGLPAVWQFVGIGHSDFGVLHERDEMTGRVVDHVGFFPVTDIDRMDDAELYRLLLQEFPDWLRAARSAGIRRRTSGPARWCRRPGLSQQAGVVWRRPGIRARRRRREQEVR